MNTWQRLKDNPKLWNQYFIREKVIRTIRRYFDENGFHEVETPILIAQPPAESYVDVFETTLLTRQRTPIPMYLSTSPEVALKKLLAAGIGDCYALTKSFRNTEMQSQRHNPEFTILEWYRVGVDYLELMADVERLVLSIQQTISGTDELRYNGKVFSLAPPWDRLTVRDAFKTYAAIDFDEFLNERNARKIAKSKGYAVDERFTWEELYNQIFLNEIEPNLGADKPVFLYEFPGSMAALSKKKESDPRYAQRFEFYIAGLELGDAYTELTDWKEQEMRFAHEIAELGRLGKTTYEYDRDFIEALKSGLPDCAGIAVGVDRLIMLFCGVSTIQETLFFPVEELIGTFHEQ